MAHPRRWRWLLAAVSGCLLFGVLMGLSQSVHGLWPRAVIAGLAGACLGGVLVAAQAYARAGHKPR